MCWALSPKSQPCNASPVELQHVQTLVPSFLYHRHKYRQNTNNRVHLSIQAVPTLPVPLEEVPMNRLGIQTPACHRKAAGSPVSHSANPSVYIQSPVKAVPIAGPPILSYPFQKNRKSYPFQLFHISYTNKAKNLDTEISKIPRFKKRRSRTRGVTKLRMTGFECPPSFVIHRHKCYPKAWPAIGRRRLSRYFL